MMVCCRSSTEVFEEPMEAFRSGFNGVAAWSSPLQECGSGSSRDGSRPCSLVAAGDDGRAACARIFALFDGSFAANCNESRTTWEADLPEPSEAEFAGRWRAARGQLQISCAVGRVPCLADFCSLRRGGCSATATAWSGHFATLLSSLCPGLTPADAFGPMREGICSRTCVRFTQPLTCYRVRGNESPLAPPSPARWMVGSKKLIGG